MKFAKYLDAQLVPEWRLKYVDYKKGKKLLKDISKGSKLPGASKKGQWNWKPTDFSENTDSWQFKGKSQNGLSHSSSIAGRNSLHSLSEINSVKSINAAGSRVMQRVLDRATRRLSSTPLEMEDWAKHTPEVRFFFWLESELQKVNSFYKTKETEAVHRFEIIRAQLMNLNSLEQAIESQGGGTQRSSRPSRPAINYAHSSWKSRLKGILKFSPKLEMPAMPASNDNLSNRHSTYDYRFYITSKRKLRAAIFELYRALELLKQYRLLNRTAFQKILKKFDKIGSTNMRERFIQEQVDTSYIGTSDDLDTTMINVENALAEYFEKGSHKRAVEKLRSTRDKVEYSLSTFWTGAGLGLSVPLIVDGLVRSRRLNDLTIDLETSAFILQIWGGFALILLFFLLFGIDCIIWTRAKISYVFIFEFNRRDALHYKQYFEIPTLLVLVGSVLFWLNFRNFWPDKLDPTYYPLIYLSVALGIFINPFKIIHRPSRKWFAIANFRVLFSGLYSVEFRDFFLGDQYNSLSYTFGNLSLFGCLYRYRWNDPEQCNSSHSRLLGFFTTLPGIWRCLQCLRRYRDTRNVFPHLINAGKYLCTILYYMFVSLWRLNESDNTLSFSAFVITAFINALYTSAWDLLMDWSLFEPNSKHWLLRNQLGFKQVWAYYVAIVIDPIMRSTWILYAIFRSQRQQSAVLSFIIALIEIFRRSIWNIFRMENEHMTNVGRFRAVRDLPLPFTTDLEDDMEAARSRAELEDETMATAAASVTSATVGDRESYRRRDSMARATSGFRGRHAEDFERRKPAEDLEDGQLDDAEDEDHNFDDDLSGESD